MPRRAEAGPRHPCGEKMLASIDSRGRDWAATAASATVSEPTIVCSETTKAEGASCHVVGSSQVAIGSATPLESEAASRGPIDAVVARIVAAEMAETPSPMNRVLRVDIEVVA